MTNYLAFTPEPFSIELTYADLVKATKRAGAESVRISLRFEGNDTFEFKGPIRSDDFLVALATSAAIEADKHMDKVLAQVIEELTEAIRLSLEYIGTQKLQARPGWSWFDALVKYAPHKAELFGPVFPDAPAEPAEDPEDKPDFKPNAMAVYASNTDERVVVHSPDRTTFKYVRGAFNQNGDFITLDRLHGVPDGYRLVNWGRDDIEADA